MDRYTTWILIIIFVAENIMILTSMTTSMTPKPREKCSKGSRKHWGHRPRAPELRFKTDGPNMDLPPELQFASYTKKSGEPDRNKYYNPNYGYEPYWAGGGWVYKTSTVGINDTTSGNCGDTCSPIYIRFGPICGRSLRLKITQTFENYCAMRSKDCIKRNAWYIQHRGRCRPNVSYFSTIPGWSTTVPLVYVVQASNIIANFSARYTEDDR